MEREQLNRIRPGGAEEWKQRRAQGGAGEQKASDPQVPAGERKQPHLQDPTGERKQSHPQAPAGTHIQILPQPSPVEKKAPQAPAVERKAPQLPDEERKAPPPRLPDEERKAAQDPDEKLKRSYLVKLLIMLVLVGALALYTTIAWFTMNKETGTSGMGVKVAGMPFELEVRGNFIENSSIMTTDTMFTNEFKSGTQQEDSEGNLVNVFRTDPNNEKIVWRKNASSAAYPQGLSPSSSGELSFYVIPNQTGVLDLHFSIRIRGYHAVYENETLTDLVEITENLTDSAENAAIGISSAATKKTALKYVNGHILFFRSYDSSTDKYSGFCGRDTIDFVDFIEGADKTVTKDQAYPVIIYWKWVNDFGDMFLTSSSTYASAPIFADSNTADRDLIFDYLEDEDTYMFSGMTSSAISNTLRDVQDSSSATFATSLRMLTTGYDNADLEIGNNVNYILFEMTASLDSQ